MKTKPHLPLEGKTAIITGASRGLGKEIAKAFWRRGASLLLVSKRAEPMPALRREFESLPMSDKQSVHLLSCDLEHITDAVVRIRRMAGSLWPKLDILVNNAAVQGPIGKVWDGWTTEVGDTEVWNATIKVNLLAPVHLCRACVPWMLKYGSGSIINISGGGATTARPNFSAYATTKSGLVRFTETLAVELAGTGIRANCVAPGILPTDMLREVLKAGPGICGEGEHEKATAVLNSPSAHRKSLCRAAELCAFLASAESEGVTGKLVSAVWDHWEDFPHHLKELSDPDVLTLRRIELEKSRCALPSSAVV